MPLLKGRRLTLLVGSYAQAFYLRDRRAATMTETVRRFADHLPEFLPLPHPSWRNTGWIRRNPWFERELLPVLRERVREALEG
jgi:uracil-DNA glycosylase